MFQINIPYMRSSRLHLKSSKTKGDFYSRKKRGGPLFLKYCSIWSSVVPVPVEMSQILKRKCV